MDFIPDVAIKELQEKIYALEKHLIILDESLHKARKLIAVHEAKIIWLESKSK